MIAKTVCRVLGPPGGKEMCHEDKDDQPQGQTAMTMAVGNLALNVWHMAALGLGLLLPVLAAGHVILTKRDSRSAIAWVGFVLFVPIVGSVMYFIFGVNRIRRKAALLRKDLERYRAEAAQPECPPDELQRHLPDHGGYLKILARVVGGVVERPLLPGNQIDPLVNGEEAYPAMLEAIQHAAGQSLSRPISSIETKWG